MDYESAINDPFAHYYDFIEWAKDIPLDENSIKFIVEILKKVEGDLTKGHYIQAVTESKSIAKNPKLFIKLTEKYQSDNNIKWIRGLVIAQYKINPLKEIKDKTSRLSYIISITHKQGLSEEIKNEIIKILKSGDMEAIAILLNNMTFINKNNEFEKLLLRIDEKHIPLFLNHIASSNMKLAPYYDLLLRTIKIDAKAVDVGWRCLYFKELEKDQLTEFCISTLKQYHSHDLRYFEWCIKEKVKTNPELVNSITDRIDELDHFNIRVLWSILTEGNPSETIQSSKKIVKLDDGKERTRKIISYYFYEIKQKLYRFGTQSDCIALYYILLNWLNGKEYIHVPSFSAEQLKNMDKKQILQIIHNISERATGNSSVFKKVDILGVLAKYPNLTKYSYNKIEEFLDNKRYHPLLVYLNNVTTEKNKNYNSSIEILDKIEYYFSHFPSIPNDKYPKKDDLIKFMVSDLFTGFDGLLSEILVFEKLHKSGLILKCEPNVGNANPDFLINLNGKEVVVEVKNYEMSEDIRLSGFGTDMGKKFDKDVTKAFFQSVPKYSPQYPVLLVFDTRRSLIDDDMVHDVFHGKLSFLISIEKPQDDTIAYRKQDFLSSNYKLSSFVQAAILFRPKLIKNQLLLDGSVIEHKYRDKILVNKDFECLDKIFF